MQLFLKIYLLFILFVTILLSGCSVMEQSDKEFTYRKYLGCNGQEVRFCLEPGAKKHSIK